MDEEQFQSIIRTRARKHTNESFRFFWASFVLQILVYASLSHVIVKYWGELTMIVSVLGIALYIPFTVVFMGKYKSMAIAHGSINNVISRRIELLESFYTFKKRYELILIPVATFIGTFVVFELWVPGSIWEYPSGAMMTFLISLVSCIVAIRAENKKSFDIPLSKLKTVLDDLKE